MRLKDTKTVKAMIDRMNAQGGVDIATEINENSTNEQAAGAKAVYDFAASKPTYPAKGDTMTILRDGYVITIDCSKLKTVIIERWGDFATMQVGDGAWLKVGRQAYGGSEFATNIFKVEPYDNNTKCGWVMTTTVEQGSVDCTGTTLWADVLDSLGTKTGTVLDADEYPDCVGVEIDLGYIALMTGDDPFTQMVLSQEEVSKFITITKPE
jgi:hypothetical protein